MSDSYIIESHVRHYMLCCSAANRAGKFTRVSAEAIVEVNSLVDSVIRQIESKIPEPLMNLPATPDIHRLITGYAMDKCRDRLEAAVRKIIANKVQRTPSVGVTI